MAMTKFTVEGEALLGYVADEFIRDRTVQIKDDGSGDTVFLEQLIANNLNFPNSEEFDQHFERMDELRQQELQPMDGRPDILREGTRLRITVEVIDGDEE